MNLRKTYSWIEMPFQASNGTWFSITAIRRRRSPGIACSAITRAFTVPVRGPEL